MIKRSILPLAALLIGCLAPVNQSLVEASTPQNISQNNTGTLAQEQQITLDDNGNGSAVWSMVGGAKTIVQAARLVGGVWQAPQDISQNIDGTLARTPQIALDGSGNGSAVWMFFNGTNSIIEAARLVGGVWQAPQDISQNASGTDANFPQIALEENGNGIAVWEYFSSGITIIQAARLVGGVWQSPQNISQNASGTFADFPQIALDGSGNGSAVWRFFNGTKTIVQAALLVGGVWQTPQDISQNADGTSATAPQIALGDGGDGSAVWTIPVGAKTIAQAARLVGGVWQAPEDISQNADGTSAIAPQIAMDYSGDGSAVWAISLGAETIVQAARLVGGVWQTPQDISQNTFGEDALTPQIALNGSGDGSAVWQLRNGMANTFIIYAARLIGGVWQAPENISQNVGSTRTQFPQIAVNDSGKGSVVWQLGYIETNTTIIQATSFDNILSPIDLKVSCINNYWHSFANVVKGSAPLTGEPPISYNLYDDPGLTNLIGTAPANESGGFTFIDGNRCKCVNKTYYIVSVNGQNVSAPAVVRGGARRCS